MHVDGLQMVLGGRKEGTVNQSDMQPKIYWRKREVIQAKNLHLGPQLILDDSPCCVSSLPCYFGADCRCQIYPHFGSRVEV